MSTERQVIMPLLLLLLTFPIAEGKFNYSMFSIEKFLNAKNHKHNIWGIKADVTFSYFALHG